MARRGIPSPKHDDIIHTPYVNILSVSEEASKCAVPNVFTF